MKREFQKKAAYYGLLTALAFIFSYLESNIPVIAGIPGIKLGLANLIILVALFYFGGKDAFAINMVRIILAGFTFGSLYSMFYSLCGGMVSFLIMFLLYKSKKFSIIGISMAGGVAHNMGQIFAAMFIVRTSQLVFYMPVLMLAGLLTGMINGYLGKRILKHLPGNGYC